MRVNLDISEVNIKQLLLNEKNEQVLEQLRRPARKRRSKENYTLMQQITSLGQVDIVREMLAVDGVFLNLTPSLFDIAESNNDYEMMKLLVNDSNYNKHKDLVGTLNQIQEHECLFHIYIKEKSVMFLCALLSSPRITLCE